MPICLAGVLWIATASQHSFATLTYSQFVKQVRTGQIANIVVMGGNSGALEAICRLTDGHGA